MHDLDHTLLESEEPEFEDPAAAELEPEDAAYAGEYEGADEGEYQDREEAQFEEPFTGESETGLSEEEEMALASEVLGVQDEAELEYFLGKLLGKVARGAGQAMRSSVGRSLVGILKNAAKKALPIAGTALGGAIGGPLGTALGGQLASQAGQMLGLELEGLSAEDQEFESARQFVRLAGSAAKNALGAVTGGLSPVAAASQAVASAARTYAPGLLRGAGTAVRRHLHSGRWVRRGHTIVLLGV